MAERPSESRGIIWRNKGVEAKRLTITEAVNRDIVMIAGWDCEQVSR